MLRGLRNALGSIVPTWLANRVGRNVGFRILYVPALFADILMTYTIEGIYAWFPGYALGATNLSVDQASALPLIGRSRGIAQGLGESNASFATRLLSWLVDWTNAGSAEILLEQVWSYLGSAPMIRIIDRSGNWVTIASDGTISKTSAAWNWDGTSNPERAGYWSDMWIVVYPDQFGARPGTLGELTGDDGFGLGHMVPHAVADTVRAILEQWKGAHVYLRAILWTTDATKYDPANPGSLPDGQWGQWSAVQAGDGDRYPSHRDLVSTRYWEPEVTP